MRAVPQLHVGHGKTKRRFLPGDRGFFLRHYGTVWVLHGQCQTVAAVTQNRCLHGAGLDVGGQQQTIGTVFGNIEMRFVRKDQQFHLPIQTAEEGKVCLRRVDRQIGVVVHLHSQLVFAAVQVRGQIHGEGGETAAMFAHKLPVTEHRCHFAGSAETDKYLGSVGRSKGFLVPTDTLIVVIAAVLPVQGVPGMGQVDSLPRRFAVLAELPALIER